MKGKMNRPNSKISRRDFIRTSTTAALSVAVLGAGAGRTFAAGSDKIRIGFIGCGGQGTRDIIDCVNSSEGVEIVAMGDLFQDRLDQSLEKLKKDVPDALKVTPETCFIGFDAYKKVLACDINMAFLTTWPHFRPEHFDAAIKAGKHVFMEKPAAVDPVGIRSIIKTAELADEKGLSVVGGTQRRHEPYYIELMRRIHNGDVGELVAAQCYWNAGNRRSGAGAPPKPEDMSEMEYQLRYWYFFTWVGGDHIVEQHVHNIDVINWAFNTHPVKALAIGGNAARGGEGNIFDHFGTEFEYPNGARVFSMCRHWAGCPGRVSERVVGTKGTVYFDGAGYIEGPNAYKYDGENLNPYIVEQAYLIKNIRSGKHCNEAKQLAESTLAAIMARMSAYTGRELKWDWVMQKSQLDLRPDKYEFCAMPRPERAVPGKTKLI